MLETRPNDHSVRPFVEDSEAVGRQLDLGKYRLPARTEVELRARYTGNVDVDTELDPDVWSVCTHARTLSDGTTLPACSPFHEVNDIAAPRSVVFRRQ